MVALGLVISAGVGSIFFPFQVVLFLTRRSIAKAMRSRAFSRREPFIGVR